MSNLRRDSVVSNAMSADTEYRVNYRKTEIEAPFLVACATDGCFGYVRSPMHFEHLVLSHLVGSRNPDSWSAALPEGHHRRHRRRRSHVAARHRCAVRSVPGAVQVVAGANSEREFIGPMEERARAVADAERQLAAARQRQDDTIAEILGSVQARIRAVPAAGRAGGGGRRRRAPRGRSARGGAGGRGVLVKAGDVINGYTILEDFKVVGAGLSKWTFAERGGRTFFIKEFLSPTYPEDDAPGSPKTKAKKRARCSVVVAHPRATRTRPAVRLRRKSDRHAGLLSLGGEVLQGDREGRRFRSQCCGRGQARLPYPARADEDSCAQPEDPARPADRPRRPQAQQHPYQADRAGLHHQAHRFRQRLYRWQSSAAGRIVGTINYYSPELLGYIQEAGVVGSQLGVASDIFALGLIYTEYLTAAPPPFDVATYTSRPWPFAAEGRCASLGPASMRPGRSHRPNDVRRGSTSTDDR